MNDIRSLSSTDKALILFTLSAVNQIEIAAVTGIGFFRYAASLSNLSSISSLSAVFRRLL